MLLNGREGPSNYRLNLSEEGKGSKGDWTTPRHRHTKEQFRYVLSGEYHITDKEILPEGWCAYFPESAWYGPQIKTENLSILTLQFGGPSGLGHMSPREYHVGIDKLKERGGKFENGIYTWIDKDGKKHNQDAAEAAEEGWRGHPIEYPASRYKDVIMMNPAAFSWISDRDNPGVARKHLGTFSERAIRFAVIRLEKGASLPFGQENAPELLFMKEGAITHDNVRFNAKSAFSIEADESPVALTAVEPCELIYMKLPTF